VVDLVDAAFCRSRKLKCIPAVNDPKKRCRVCFRSDRPECDMPQQAETPLPNRPVSAVASPSRSDQNDSGDTRGKTGNDGDRILVEIMGGARSGFPKQRGGPCSYRIQQSTCPCLAFQLDQTGGSDSLCTCGHYVESHDMTSWGPSTESEDSSGDENRDLADQRPRDDSSKETGPFSTVQREDNEKGGSSARPLSETANSPDPYRFGMSASQYLATQAMKVDAETSVTNQNSQQSEPGAERRAALPVDSDSEDSSDPQSRSGNQRRLLAHMDLKPDNIRVEEGDDGTSRWKLSDFGISSVAETETRGDGAEAQDSARVYEYEANTTENDGLRASDDVQKESTIAASKEKHTGNPDLERQRDLLGTLANQPHDGSPAATVATPSQGTDQKDPASMLRQLKSEILALKQELRDAGVEERNADEENGRKDQSSALDRIEADIAAARQGLESIEVAREKADEDDQAKNKSQNQGDPLSPPAEGSLEGGAALTNTPATKGQTASVAQESQTKDIPPVRARWTDIRNNAAARAARSGSFHDGHELNVLDSESDEEGAEHRRARIQKRVVELLEDEHETSPSSVPPTGFVSAVSQANEAMASGAPANISPELQAAAERVMRDAAKAVGDFEKKVGEDLEPVAR
jgi:hypothetical protein